MAHISKVLADFQLTFFGLERCEGRVLGYFGVKNEFASSLKKRLKFEAVFCLAWTLKAMRP